MMSAKQWWVAWKGVRKYEEAKRSGDIADANTQAQRALVCQSCDSMTTRKLIPLGMRELGFCGDPLIETKTTCGCVVIAEDGEGGWRAAGATEVGTKTCLQNKWPDNNAP